MESGGSNGSSGTQDGGTKGMLAVPELIMHELTRDSTHNARALTDCTIMMNWKQHETEALLFGVRSF
jgi:hypothetical protein